PAAGAGWVRPPPMPCHASMGARPLRWTQKIPAAPLGPKSSGRLQKSLLTVRYRCVIMAVTTHKEGSPVYTLEYFLDLAGWRLIEDDGTEWRWGDKVSWWEPIGAEYVAAIGVIQGFNFDEEAA